ncbi:MAG: glycosyltransferase family 39 protein [Chthoniobacter sp.]
MQVNEAGRAKAVNLVIYFVIVAGTLARIWDCFYFNPLDHLFSDPLRHWLNGQRLLNPDLMGASDPIGYQCFVFLVHLVSGGGRFGVALCAGLLSAVMPYTFYRASRELGIPRSPAILFWAALCWTPSLFAIYHYFAMETLLLVLIGLSLWSTGRYLRTVNRVCWWQTSGLWTLCVLTKPTALPLAVTCLGYAWWRKSRSPGDAGIAIGIAVALLLPNAFRSDRVLHFPAPLGNAWITKIQHLSGARTIEIHWKRGKWFFSSPSCYVRPLEPLSSWMITRAGADSRIIVDINPEYGARDWEVAHSLISVGLGERITQLSENLLLFLFAPSWPDCNLWEIDGWWSYIGRWMWAPLIFFLLSCNLLEFRAGRFDLVPVATTVFTLFLGLQNFATMEGRYRKPLEPLLLLNVAWVVSRPPAGLRRRNSEIGPRD